ncbi:shikimate kinase [Alkalihalobacillus pseudalcaliphilus]|uniref:shikimate kinase n=1 Tax=Alkalihalobacillus pseudalcaliphilus TaxID=79884 RepID=UPI00069F24E0|nr:shikimate kinase [Alkalihalobacillus pseudalcaliphilus]
MHEVIYLTGFMGSGKTTVGEQLSKALGVRVIDTDEWIESQEQKTINEIFKEHGEAYFRLKETEALLEIQDKQLLLVTTGGGIVLKDENKKIMQERGQVIYLDCDLDAIFERVAGDTSRPLLHQKSKEDIRALFEMRKNDYLAAATMVCDTTGKSVRQVVQELKEKVLKK